MRLAVAMPGLERDSLHCRALEMTLGAMAEAGVDLEGFAEHDRLAGEHLDFPVYHYLRLPERHRCLPFDVALYPVGRDASPYQAACWLMPAHDCRCMQINIGMRFAALDIADTEDVAREKIPQPGFTQGESHLVVRTTRGDTKRNRKVS